MGLKLTLYSNDKNCNELISVEITHFSNFNGENEYHIFETEMIKLSTLLIQKKIPFKTSYSSIIILGNIRIRLDNFNK